MGRLVITFLSNSRHKNTFKMNAFTQQLQNIKVEVVKGEIKTIR